eukprot:GHVP01032720.1.p1 GENE.GHVP01032720.1~~GHVP01032720.1.p1  ORF type:complete len:290 (+),score=20.66 GHVP01032720.1:46-915(+)
MKNILGFFLLLFTLSRGVQNLFTFCLAPKITLSSDGESCATCKGDDLFCFTSANLREPCGDVPKRPCPAMMVREDGHEEYCGRCFKRVPLFDCEEFGCRETYVKVVQSKSGKTGSTMHPGMYVTGNVFTETCTTCFHSYYHYLCKDPSDKGCLPIEAQVLPDVTLPEYVPVVRPCDPFYNLYKKYNFRNVQFDYEEVDCDSGPEPTNYPTMTFSELTSPEDTSTEDTSTKAFTTKAATTKRTTTRATTTRANTTKAFTTKATTSTEVDESDNSATALALLAIGISQLSI